MKNECVPPVAAHFDSDVTQRRRGALPSPWGRWRGAVLWHCTVTDEGSPLKAGLTAVRTTDIEIKESRLTAGFFYFSDIRRQAREKKYGTVPHSNYAAILPPCEIAPAAR